MNKILIIYVLVGARVDVNVSYIEEKTNRFLEAVQNTNVKLKLQIVWGEVTTLFVLKTQNLSKIESHGRKL